jgi:hypothetical protein
MNKKTLFSAVVAIFLFATIFPAMAAKPDISELPEQSGIYDVPGKANLKLRVFVHQVKPGKPAPTPQQTCQNISLADPDSSSVVAGAGWKMPSTWVYRLNPNSVPASVGSANLEAIAGNSFAAWNGPLGGAVSISKGANTTVNKATLDGQNVVTWGRTSASALAVSYIWYNQVTGALTEVDTIMNQRYSWYWSNPILWQAGSVCAYLGVYDAQNIMTHEFGHTVGLDDEYTAEFQNNTMYGYGSLGEVKKNTITTGDSAGVNALYW